MSIIVEVDYKDDLELLLQVFKEKPNFVSILEKIGDEFNKPQKCLLEIRDNFQIDTAEGEQLNIIGKIQGIGRLGLSDNDYRNRIKLQIAINNGSGTPEDLISAISGIYSPDKVQIVWQENANLEIFVLNVSMDYDDYNSLLRLVAAGVNLLLVIGGDTPFVFYDDTDGLGFNCMLMEDLTFSDSSTVTFSDDSTVEMVDVTEFDDEGGELSGLF